MLAGGQALPAADALYDHAACGLLLTAADGTIRRANATLCAWLGYRAADLVDTLRFQDLLTMGGRVFHQTHWAPLLQMQGSLAEVKLDLRHRDGHTVPMLINARRGRHGETRYDELALIVVQDRHQYERELLLARKAAEASLEQRVTAERALQESRDVLGLAMRSSQMGIWTRDLGTGTVWWSRELEELVGLEEGAFAGTLTGFRDFVHRQDLPTLDAAVARAIETQSDYTVEFRFLHRSGQWRWMEGRGRATYDQAGKPTMLYGLGIDITERKSTESAMLRQAAIFEHQTDAIVLTDLKGRIIDFNPAAARMLGYTAAEVLGQPISIFHPPEEADRLLRQGTEKLLRDGQWRSEIEFIRKDGSRGICESVFKPLINGQGVTYATVGISRDVTESRMARVQLQQLNEQLSLADRRKDEFLATLAHELRNPLAPMRNIVGVLHHHHDAHPQLRPSLDVLERQLQQMTHLVDDLLEISRITQGKLALRRTRVDLAAAMKDALEAAAGSAQAAGHELVVSLPEPGVVLDADMTRIVQAILNLLNNAVKYTPQAGRIWVEGRCEGGEAMISVRDSGIGIAVENLPRVFGMFEQVAPALENPGGGLGIGLALVRALVELHGGSVAAFSAGIGQGSEFVIRLPLASSEAAALLPVLDPAPVAESPLRRQRILVVDDNVDAAESLAALLEIMGHDVGLVHDGAAALEMARTFAPTTILLDIGLPRVNGYDVARRIRSEPWGASINLVAVTGWGQEKDKAAALAAGFDRHVTKPLDPLDLENILGMPTRAPVVPLA